MNILFSEIAEDAIRALPDELKSKLDNIQVVIEDYPSSDSLKKLGIKSQNALLGLYHGVPWGRRTRRYANVLPDMIILYEKPIRRLCKRKEDLVEKVKEVVFHEIGHYFGFSDADLNRMLDT